jgi:hypothetical protein
MRVARKNQINSIDSRLEEQKPPNLYAIDLCNIDEKANEILQDSTRLLTHTDKQHIEPEDVNRCTQESPIYR